MSLKGIKEIYSFSGKPKEIKLQESVYVLDTHVGDRKVCVYAEAELPKRLPSVNFDIVVKSSPPVRASETIIGQQKKLGVCKAKIPGVTGFYICLPKLYSGTIVESAWDVACLCMKRASPSSASSSFTSSSMSMSMSPSQSPSLSVPVPRHMAASTSTYFASSALTLSSTTPAPTGITPSSSSTLSAFTSNNNNNNNNNINIINNGSGIGITNDEGGDEWTVIYDVNEIRNLALGREQRSAIPIEPEESMKAKIRTEWAKSVWESISSTAYNSEKPYLENFSNGLFTRFSDQLRDCGIKGHVFMKLLSKALCDDDDGRRVYVSYDKWLRFAACFWRGVDADDSLIDWNEALSVTSASWFKGVFTAVQTENAFSGLPDGQFLLRYSDSMWMFGCIDFSMYRRGKTVKYYNHFWNSF